MLIEVVPKEENTLTSIRSVKIYLPKIYSGLLSLADTAKALLK